MNRPLSAGRAAPVSAAVLSALFFIASRASAELLYSNGGKRLRRSEIESTE